MTLCGAWVVALVGGLSVWDGLEVGQVVGQGHYEAEHTTQKEVQGLADASNLSEAARLIIFAPATATWLVEK